ncbi:hypothetical protein D3C74_384470 [compost metagenome]
MASVESVVPSPSKSHAYVSASFSGSVLAEPSNVTVSGAVPESGVAAGLATGEREPEM